jgi:hypothetical protein
MEDEIAVPAASAAAPVTGPHLRLLTFWPTNPAAWLAMAKGQFILRGIADEMMGHYSVLPSLLEATNKPGD